MSALSDQFRRLLETTTDNTELEKQRETMLDYQRQLAELQVQLPPYEQIQRTYADRPLRPYERAIGIVIGVAFAEIKRVTVPDPLKPDICITRDKKGNAVRLRIRQLAAPQAVIVEAEIGEEFETMTIFPQRHMFGPDPREEHDFGVEALHLIQKFFARLEIV